MVAYAADSQPAKPTHGGTASMLTMARTINIKKYQSKQSGFQYQNSRLGISRIGTSQRWK